jgi:Protein of unknown function (DUF2877)
MICSEVSALRLEARSIGPAAAAVLSGGSGAMRVHSVFQGTVNLEVAGSHGLVALTGPSGGIHPHAVTLPRPTDFRDWRLMPEGRVRLEGGSMWLPGGSGTVVVDLASAERPIQRPLPRLDRIGPAYHACAARLVEAQELRRCELRLNRGCEEPFSTAGMGRSLRRAALDLGQAAQGFLGSPSVASGNGPGCPSLEGAVASLIGLGEGLTPSGDDFLCGFLAAARATRPRLLPALAAAAEANLHRTGRISGFLIRCATRDFWPSPLLDLAKGLASERVPDTLAALGDLDQLGHSSGMDLAAGFLFGLETLLLEV